MLKQISDQNRDQKIKELADYLVQLDKELKSAKVAKAESPGREDLNGLIELIVAIQDEAKAVNELVKIEDDCPDDWDDLDEARASLTRMLARIDHANWVAQGPSKSRRFNKLFFHVRGDGNTKDAQAVVSELVKVSERLLAQDLAPALESRLKKLIKMLEGDHGGKFPVRLLKQLDQLEDFLDLALFDQTLDKQKSWLESFQELAAAFTAGQLEEKYLVVERNLALERLEDSTEGSVVEPIRASMRTDLDEFVDHLSALEDSLKKSEFEGWLNTTAEKWEKLEGEQQTALASQTPKCAICTGELMPGLDQCPHCGAAVLNLDKIKVKAKQPARGSSQLLDSLWDTWTAYEKEEIDQKTLLQTFEKLSAPILQVVEKMDSPTPHLLDFSNRLKTFIQLSDRNSMELKWPSLIASGQALIQERVSHLKRG